MLLVSAKCSRPCIRRRNTSRTAIWRTIPRTSNSVWFDDRISSSRFLPKTTQGSTSLVKKLHGIFVGFALYAVRIWKEDFLIGDIEELENLDTSEIHARRLHAKEVLMPKNGEIFKFPFADGSVSSHKEIRIPGPTRKRRRAQR